MGKALLSTVVLFVTVVVTIILVSIVFDKYPTFGTFHNLVWLGLTLFLAGIGVVISATLLHKAIKGQTK